MASSFTIKASPGTDVWRKPPSTDVFNAPTKPHPTAKSTSPLSHFHSARISFRLPTSLTRYDQAGLLLSFKASGATHPFSATSPPKWIKTGVEFYNGIPRAATVACDAWADWSLAPVSVGKKDADGDWVTVEVVNDTDELGKSLWVYQVVDGDDRIPLREVCWPFGQGAGDEWELRVEAYTCRPSKEAKEDLSVEFKEFEVKWI